MAQTKHDIQNLLAQANTEPRHRFGQNFMIDQNLVRLITAAGEVRMGETVLEIGPGTGTLTEELLASPAGKVIALEIDRDLAGLLRERFANEKRLTLIEGDALNGKHALNPVLLDFIKQRKEPPPAESSDLSPAPSIKLIANLPYNIASPLIIELLIAGVDLLAFTVQKEVADRLKAHADTEHYGPLSVMTQLLANVEVMRTLPPQAFWPPPRIDSSLVRLRRKDRLGAQANEFSRFLHGIFAYRRKTLRKAIEQAGFDSGLAARAGLDPTLRPELFSPDQWLNLFNSRT